MASTAGKVKTAKAVAKYRTNELKKMNTGPISGGLAKGGTVPSTAKLRTAGLNAVNSAAKTVGRAKNVESKLKKTAAKPVAKGGSAIGEIAKRFGVTAREARDIVTAVNTAGQAVANKNVRSPQTIKAAVADVKKQVKETVKAAATGKKGTGAARITDNPGDVRYQVTRGKKRM